VGDQRLQDITNKQGSTTLSKFDYTYNAVGTIATWSQQADSGTAVANTLSYDNAGQLTGEAQSGGASTTYGYNYDSAGNRLNGTVNSTTTAGQFNNLNQLVAQTSSATSTTVAGHTSAAVSSVSIDAISATISHSTNFTAHVKMPPHLSRECPFWANGCRGMKV
jgi:YD repeat-containing protein